MLPLLQSLLRTNSLYFEVEIGALPHSCCSTSAIKVLDFDKVKDEFSKILGIGENEKLKSVDAILFAASKNTLYLIEMKYYTSGGTLTCADFIKDRLSTVPPKVIDSIFLILSMMGYFNISRTAYPFFLSPKRLRIVPFLLTNLTDTQLLPLTLGNLDKLDISLTKRINENILTLTCNKFHRTFSVI